VRRPISVTARSAATRQSRAASAGAALPRLDRLPSRPTEYVIVNPLMPRSPLINPPHPRWEFRCECLVLVEGAWRRVMPQGPLCAHICRLRLDDGFLKAVIALSRPGHLIPPGSSRTAVPSCQGLVRQYGSVRMSGAELVLIALHPRLHDDPDFLFGRSHEGIDHHSLGAAGVYPGHPVDWRHPVAFAGPGALRRRLPIEVKGHLP